MKSTPASRYALAVLAAVSTGVIANAAFATTSDDTQPEQVVVRYKDLDLSLPADVDRLYARIKTAAHTVCGGFRPEQLALAARYQNCVNQAVNDAVAKVNSTQPLPLHASERRLAAGT